MSARDVYVIVWRFELRPGMESAFEALYGPSGRWVALFQEGTGYRGTELLRAESESVEYLTLDRWESVAAYEEFRRLHAVAYAELDGAGDRLTANEIHVGSFHLVEA